MKTIDQYEDNKNKTFLVGERLGRGRMSIKKVNTMNLKRNYFTV